MLLSFFTFPGDAGIEGVAAAGGKLSERRCLRSMAGTIQQEQKERYRRRLEEERRWLQQEILGVSNLLAQSDDPSLDTDAYSNHPANVGSETYEMEKNLGLLASLRSQLEATEAAIERLEAGSYGTCSNCGRPIAPERLEALPHATLCIDCKRQQEARR